MLVRLDAIGDFILWTDAAQAMAAQYRNVGNRVVLIGNQVWAEWADQLALFDEVIAVDPHRFQTRFRYRMHMGAAVRRLGASIAVNPTYSRVWLADDAVVRLSGAKERVGSAGDRSNSRGWQIGLANRWYTKLLPASGAKLTELERDAEFVRGLGQANFRARIPGLECMRDAVPDAAFLAETEGKPYYVLFPGAGWKGREWPEKNFIEIAERLHLHTGWRGVVCGGAPERATAETICADAKVLLVNWAGRSTLEQLARIIANAKLVVTNETSAIHFAAVFGVPAVCILGGGHFGRFLPYRVEVPGPPQLPVVVTCPMPCFGCNWKCTLPHSAAGPVPCIEAVGVEAVWGEIANLLGFAMEQKLVALHGGKV